MGELYKIIKASEIGKRRKKFKKLEIKYEIDNSNNKIAETKFKKNIICVQGSCLIRLKSGNTIENIILSKSNDYLQINKDTEIEIKEYTNETKNINIIKDTEIGIIQFVKDYIEIFSVYPVEFSWETIYEELLSFKKNLSAYDKTMLKEIYHSTDVLNNNYVSLYDSLKKK